MAEANLNVNSSSGKEETIAATTTTTTEQPQQLRAGLREIVVPKPTVVNGEHGLENSWVFWWSTRGAKTEVEWEHSFRLLGSFGSVEQFWRLFSSFSLALDLKPKFEVYMFRFGFKPLWEDEENKAGGKFMIVLPKGLTTKLWEKLILSLIGEQMEIGPQIVGIVLSPRYLDDHISIWIKDANTHAAIKEKIQTFFSEVAPEKVTFKAHVESIKDSAIYESKMKETLQQRDSRSGGHLQQGYNNNNAQYNANQGQGQGQGQQGSYNNYSGGSNYRGNNNRYHQQQHHQQGQQGQLNNSGEQQGQQHNANANTQERDPDGFTFKKFNKGQTARSQAPSNQNPGENNFSNTKNYRNSPNRNTNVGTGGYVNPNRVRNTNTNNNSSNNSSNNNDTTTMQNFSELQTTTGMSLYPQRPNANNNSNNSNTSTNNNASSTTGN